MNQTELRMPAEWEPQDGILLAWPHEGTDWAATLDRVIPVYRQLVAAISRFERVIIVAPDTTRVRHDLGPLMSPEVGLVDVPTNDTWTRDFGPLTTLTNGRPRLHDFTFNGWGLKFPADLDNRINVQLAELGLFRPRLRTENLVLEGGSLESDGHGTLLTTSACLLSPNRNPHLGREQIAAELQRRLGASQLLWLDHGHLLGDDTDSHVDTLARFAPDNHLLYQGCDDPKDPHFADLEAMTRELHRLSNTAGEPYRLRRLPWPQAIYDSDGGRLPATYANFLILNRAVLVPTYADPADKKALAVVAEAFPGREVIGIDARPLIEQHGSIHCITMQLPRGVLHEFT